MILRITVGRPASRRLLEDSLPQGKTIGLFAQKDPARDEPDPANLHRVGLAADVLKLTRRPDTSVSVLLNLRERIAVREVLATRPFIRARVEVLAPANPPPDDKRWQALVHELRDTALELLSLLPEAPEDAMALVREVDDGGRLADLIAGSLDLEPSERQDLLEELDADKRIRAVLVRVNARLEIAHLQKKIQQDVAQHFTDAQRRSFLRQQLQSIQRELGETEEGPKQESKELRRRLEEAKPPGPVLAVAGRELERLERIHPASPEHALITSYLETLAELPWNQLTRDQLDLARAQEILDRDHYDLEKVKRRLLEFLAVRKLNPTGQGPILCLTGPPGVGKTSLGQSIADALGRKFIRFSLGGMRDEAEIRGHRRTYVGAMPGRILQELRRAGSRNPVFMLDEIDKLGNDFRGDPASALLEVLDPRQNHTFADHYLGVPFDLSQVIFIATANYMGAVPPALRDRMEVIEISGYTDREKIAIAQRYLVPRQLRENGLQAEQCRFDEEALELIRADYTQEAGVREFERQIGAVCRAVAALIAREESKGVTIDPAMVRPTLGPARYVGEERLHTAQPGVVTGLAWTPVGGRILHIEALRYPGKGNIVLTGQIGEVMKESAQAALSLVKSRSRELGLDPEEFGRTDVHIHVPAGAVPKDGPSAGIAMFTAIASLFCVSPVRPDVAMTGEISLRGLVLPIGGLKEKCLAALRAGLTTVVLPGLNEKDLPDLPEEARNRLELVPVKTVDEVLSAALEENPARAR
jgi:ATP-dependent Lon protease